MSLQWDLDDAIALATTIDNRLGEGRVPELHAAEQACDRGGYRLEEHLAEEAATAIEHATLALYRLAPIDDLAHPAWDAHLEWRRVAGGLPDRLRDWEDTNGEDDDED